MTPSHPPVAVHAWPQNMPLAVAELRAGSALTVISVTTPATTHRLQARALIRTALRETLAAFLQQPPAAITLGSHPGQAIWVASPLTNLQLSVSHMPGLSVAAIAHSAVGIDVMPIPQGADAMPDWADVALDYLGASATDLLHRTPSAQRPSAFAQAWVQLEARLKCQGLALTEWSPTLAQQLATCRVSALALPDHCCGAVAVSQTRVRGESDVGKVGPELLHI